MDSRKRNHRSSSVSGTLTRSRSQLFLHRNSSGQLRSDSRPRQEEELYSGLVRFRRNGARQESSEDKVLVKDPCKRAKRDDGDLSLPLAKDLRARRVYSPQSSAGGASSDLFESAFPKGSAVDSDGADGKTADLGFGSTSSADDSGMCADDVMMSARIEATESADLGLSSEARGNTEASDESGKLQDDMQIDGKNGGDSSEKIDDFVEEDEPVLTTPPDAEMCGDSKVNGDVGKREEELRVKDTPCAGNTEEISSEGFSGKDGQRNDSVLKRKSVLRPRFQRKLFKAPGSVSYSKLFPFLMDIMGDDFGTPKSGRCHKDEKGMDEQEFQLPLSSQSQEASKHGLETDSCTMRDTNESKLTSSPMRLDAKEVSGDCLSVPSVDGKCVSESKADPTADFHRVNDVGNALHNDDFKQYSIHKDNLDHAKANNHCGCTSEQFGVLNEDCVLTPPGAEIYDNSVVNVDELQSMPQDARHIKPMDLTRSTQEIAIERFWPKVDKRNDPLKSKSVPRPHMQKLFKKSGSVSYRRLLPFLMDLTKDDSGTSKFGHRTYHKNDEVDMYAKGFQLPLPSQSEEASINGQKTVCGPMDDTVESNALENNILVNPAIELSHGCRPKLTSSQYFSELPMQLDAKEVVHKCLSAPSVKEHTEKVVIGSKDECLSESKFDPCSVMVDFHCAKIVANAAHNDGFTQVQKKISGQRYSESPPKDQNMLYINDDVSTNLTFEHHSSKEKGFAIDYDERKQFVNVDKDESSSRCPPEGQSLSQLDPNMLDAEENETRSRAIDKTDDAVVLNHVSVSNEEPRPPSEKVISEKPDMAAHGGDKAERFLKGIVYGSRMSSKGSNDKNASCAGEIENGSESKTTLVLNRCPRMKLLKHAGSFNYKRLLPFFLNTIKYNSCASINDHYPKLQKLLDQTPLLPISDSNLRVTPISDSNDCVPMDHCTGNSGAQQETGLQACDLNNDGSSPISQIPEFQSSHDSYKVIQLQDEQLVLNGPCMLETPTDLSISVHRDLPITSLGPIIDEVITREEATSAISESSVYSEVTRNSSFAISSNEEKPPETHGCSQSLSQLKVTEQLRVPAVGFRKGILKRNPRGCRGLCTCLNYASFRLHAERAFEFSRNQLLDAEEVAQDLMKELSHLRNMLERFTDSVNNNPVFDGSQVKEACRKAFETEQLAKDRLSQMNDDLNIHCRISSLQRPRVRFADHVEEKVIQSGR